MALGVGATEKAPWKSFPLPSAKPSKMWLRCATSGPGNSPSHWWCRSCDGDHSALGGLLLWSQRTAGGDGAYHVCILHELGAAELAALFLYGEWLALSAGRVDLALRNSPQAARSGSRKRRNRVLGLGSCIQGG